MLLWLSSWFSVYAEELRWKVIGHLLEARTNSSSAVIGDGRILVFGGFKEQFGIQKQRLRGVVSSSSEIIDIRQRRITRGAEMHTPHAIAPVIQMPDSNLIILGGLDSDSTTTPICEIYDRKRNEWRVLGRLLFGRHLHSAALLNAEEVIVIGGRAGGNYAAIIAESEIFNIRTGKSRKIADFPCKIEEGAFIPSTIFQPGKSIYVGGRTNGSAVYRPARIYYYDKILEQWKYVGEFLDAVFAFASTQMIQTYRNIIVGGAKPLGLSRGIENIFKHMVSNQILIETSSGFECVSSLRKGRYHCQVKAWSSEIALIFGGGDDDYVAINNSEWFDMKSQSTIDGPQMNDARYGFHSFTLPTLDNQGNQIGASIIAFGGKGLNDVSATSVEVLETADVSLVNMPDNAININRWRKIFSSPVFIGGLVLFIAGLVFSLAYLLFQIIRLRQKSRLAVLHANTDIEGSR